MRIVIGWLLVTGLLVGCSPPQTPGGALKEGAPVKAREPEPVQAPSETTPDGLLTLEAFANRVASRLKSRMPDHEVVNQQSTALELWRGQELGPTVQVEPAYDKYKASPARLEAIVEETITNALAFDQLTGNWDDVRARVLPRMISAERFQEMAETYGTPLHVQMSETVFLVADLAFAEQKVVVTTALQLRWNKQARAIWDQAISNLAERTPPPDQLEGRAAWVWHVNDGYDSARLLLVERLRDLAGRVKGNLVLAVPSQHALYAFDDSDAELVQQMKSTIESDAKRLPDPIEADWLMIKQGQLTRYQPANGS